MIAPHFAGRKVRTSPPIGGKKMVGNAHGSEYSRDTESATETILACCTLYSEQKVKRCMVSMFYQDIQYNIGYMHFLLVTAMNGKPHLEQEQTLLR